MPPPLVSGSKRSEALWSVVGLAAFLALLALDRGRAFNYAGQPTFWDAHVYARAIHIFQEGKDPYTRDSPLMFVYPPIFLYGASALSHVIHGALAWKLYLLLDLLSIVAIPVIVTAGYLRSPWFNAGCALLVSAFHPYFMSALSFFAGNLSNLLYASVLLAGVPGVRRNRWAWFYAATILAAAIKLPMLAFLLLPVLLGGGQSLPSAIAGLAVFLVNAVQLVVTPVAYQSYLEAARYQVLVRSDVGFGIFSTLFRIARQSARVPHWLPFLVHTLIFGSLGAALCWARKRGIPRELRNWWVSLVLLLAVLCNPRMLAYDIDVLLVPTAFLIVEALGAGLARKQPSIVLVGCVLAAIIALGRSALNAYCLLAVVCFPIAGYLWLTSSPVVHDDCNHVSTVH